MKGIHSLTRHTPWAAILYAIGAQSSELRARYLFVAAEKCVVGALADSYVCAQWYSAGVLMSIYALLDTWF